MNSQRSNISSEHATRLHRARLSLEGLCLGFQHENHWPFLRRRDKASPRTVRQGERIESWA